MQAVLIALVESLLALGLWLTWRQSRSALIPVWASAHAAAMLLLPVLASNSWEYLAAITALMAASLFYASHLLQGRLPWAVRVGAGTLFGIGMLYHFGYPENAMLQLWAVRYGLAFFLLASLIGAKASPIANVMRFYCLMLLILYGVGLISRFTGLGLMMQLEYVLSPLPWLIGAAWVRYIGSPPDSPSA